MSWSFKLLETMKDPDFIILKTEQIVVIKDKFPKAKHHFLVLPYDKINTIFDLEKNHIKLVKDMEILGHNAIESTNNKKENFKLGFHAQPSMIR